MAYPAVRALAIQLHGCAASWISYVFGPTLRAHEHARSTDGCAGNSSASCGEPMQAAPHTNVYRREIGRASCRERVCKYVSISVVAVSLKNTSIVQAIDT